MEQDSIKEIKCKHCNESFTTKGIYQVHYRNIHQNQHTVKDKEDSFGLTITRSEATKFECICSKSYATFQALQKHWKSCKTWKDKSTENELETGIKITLNN